MDAVGVKTLLQTVLDFDKCDIQVLLAAMTSVCVCVCVWREGGEGRVGGIRCQIRKRESEDSGWCKAIMEGRR